MQSDKTQIDYGPLTPLIGIWNGDKGLDIAPGPNKTESNLYSESIIYTAIGNVTNAEHQVLTALHYRQIVKRKTNGQIFHDETGYWMWDSKAQIIMHSFVIPRGICVLAGGTYSGSYNPNQTTTLQVTAKINDINWPIIQSPFMQENACTTAFSHKITIANGKMAYLENTTVEIHAKVFEHSDQNELYLLNA